MDSPADSRPHLLEVVGEAMVTEAGTAMPGVAASGEEHPGDALAQAEALERDLVTGWRFAQGFPSCPGSVPGNDMRTALMSVHVLLVFLSFFVGSMQVGMRASRKPWRTATPCTTSGWTPYRTVQHWS